ncbi:hypothetical protein ACFUNF_41055 [Streptomyces sp. NPDC057291]|uniref:hypothetical protein n=1 Tax=Streptomyces sp. NPDC057291 TaxID=3346087 RepID=UPI003639EBF8
MTDSPTLDLTVSGTGTAADPYDITGTVIVDPAPPGGNLLQAGPDGLFVLPADLPVVGCGLTGDGTAAAPITANPIAGEAEWAAAWACADETYSTLKCDPSTGALWTPPEHSSASVSQQQSHFAGTFAQGVTAWAIIDPVVYSEGTCTAGELVPL